jgi:hypothetical protein
MALSTEFCKTDDSNLADLAALLDKSWSAIAALILRLNP